MRRMMLLLVAVAFLGSLGGCCRLMHSHGICDCEEDNHCAERAPWLRMAPPSAPEKVSVPPVKLLEGKE